MSTTCTNLSTLAEMTFAQDPGHAVVLAWLYDNGFHVPARDWHKAPAVSVGDRSVSCGDWCAMVSTTAKTRGIV